MSISLIDEGLEKKERLEGSQILMPKPEKPFDSADDQEKAQILPSLGYCWLLPLSPECPLDWVIIFLLRIRG